MDPNLSITSKSFYSLNSKFLGSSEDSKELYNSSAPVNIITGKNIRKEHKKNLDTERNNSLNKFLALKPKNENAELMDKFYWVIIEVTFLLQNDYSASISEEDLSILSSARVAGHRGFRYDLTYEMVFNLIVEFFRAPNGSAIAANEYAKDLCIILTHENETFSRSGVSLKRITEQANELLKQFGVIVRDDITEERCKIVERRLAKGKVYYCKKFAELGEKEEKSIDSTVPIPDFSNPQSNYYKVKYHINNLEVYKLYLGKLQERFSNPSLFGDLNTKLDQAIEKFGTMLNSPDKNFDIEFTTRINGHKLEDKIEDIKKLIKLQFRNKEYSEYIDYLLKLAKIDRQKAELNRLIENTIELKLNIGSKCRFITGLAGPEDNPQQIEPSIVRSAVNLLNTYNNREHLNNPINLFKHTIKFWADANDDKSLVSHTIIRNGALHSVEAAKAYLKVMIDLEPDNEGNCYIVDNRILFDNALREKNLLDDHVGFIKDAIKELERELGRKIYVYFLNFQDKDMYFASPSERHHTWLNRLENRFNTIISGFEESKSIKQEELKQEELKQGNKVCIEKIKFCHDLFEAEVKNKNRYTGENALNLAFLIQYLCGSLKIPYSEGCKSNKDRGSMKKMRDEIFFIKMQLNQNYKLTFDEFFTINEYDLKSFAREVSLNNTSAYVTFLNTGIPGNKSVGSHTKLLTELELSASDFEGHEEFMKAVET